MSKIPYTIDVKEYICSELERIRQMTKTLDFSSLLAVVERIQFHASSMEAALYRWKDFRYDLQQILDDEKDDDKLRERLKEKLAEMNK